MGERFRRAEDARGMPARDGLVNIPTLEAHLRAFIDASDVPNALSCFERLLRRRRTPHQATCTALVALCVTHSPRDVLFVLEAMGEARNLEVDDFNRIARSFLQRNPDPERLARFQEVALDLLNFSDDSMHNYFAHIATLLNIELRETLTSNRDTSAAEISLITHKRQMDAAAFLCKKGTLATPIMSLLLAGMGGREGVQNEVEMVELSTAATGLASEDALINAHALMSQMALNASQKAAVEAALSRRLTLIQARENSPSALRARAEHMASVREGFTPLCAANAIITAGAISVPLRLLPAAQIVGWGLIPPDTTGRRMGRG